MAIKWAGGAPGQLAFSFRLPPAKGVCRADDGGSLDRASTSPAWWGQIGAPSVLPSGFPCLA
jgi:hypothetical protein